MKDQQILVVLQESTGWQATQGINGQLSYDEILAFARALQPEVVAWRYRTWDFEEEAYSDVWKLTQDIQEVEMMKTRYKAIVEKLGVI